MAFRTVTPLEPESPQESEILSDRPSYCTLDKDLGRPGTPMDFDYAVDLADRMLNGFGIGSTVMMVKEGWAIVIPSWDWKYVLALETKERVQAYWEKECRH